MKKRVVLMMAMVIGLLASGCATGLVVNVNSIVDNYKKDSPEVNPLISVKCNYYHGDTSYRELRKRAIWNASSVRWTAGALIMTDSFGTLLSQREDLSVTTVFKFSYSEVEDVIIERYSNTMGLVISTTDKTFVLEIAKGIAVDKQSTANIYNLLLSKTKNTKNRQPIDLAKEAEEKKIKEEQSKPTSGGSTGWGSK